MLEDSPSQPVQPYNPGDMKGVRGASYAIVQYSPSCVRAAAVDAVCSCSGAAVHVGLTDASESGICAAENCVAGGIEPKTSALVPC
jgi:hypothetical protein